MYRKSFAHPARLCYSAHVLMENRNGLVAEAMVNQADGYGERDAALEMLMRVPAQRVTLGADKAYDIHGFIEALRALRVTPHVAQNVNRRGGSAIDGRTTRHAGYRLSQVIRKRIEEVFGWGKTVGPIRKTKFRGVPEWGSSSH